MTWRKCDNLEGQGSRYVSSDGHELFRAEYTQEWTLLGIFRTPLATKNDMITPEAIKWADTFVKENPEKRS